ncbi:divergent polysaccharide deacetylase family protein [Desulforamulus profundi]|uniref:divergent polysaccharide deacetylase family protein n=1 Tax=Desulforamulus profundi TaxID=1383067 RepID=UPI001EE631F5|nr:divergent polysaccharide deacetylase family protein [Desulforamulus profundi]
MPNLVHSVEQSKEAYKRGHEVILHQPMEPLRGKAYWLGPGAIKSSMSQEEIKKTFTENLKTVPHARGFNNHTGSKITSSKEKVTPMLEIAKSKGLYVLDSRTSQHSQIIPVARSMQVPWIKRDIFLDNIKSKGHIKKQIMKACEVAKKQGYAVAIGHVGQGGRVTASAVKEAIPLIEKEGVKLVPLSEIVKLKNGNGKV